MADTASNTSNVKTYLPSLDAEIIGELDSSNIALFRGIPYATIDKRWTQSKIYHHISQDFDATKYGPRCPQRNSPGLMSGSVPDPFPGDDEFRCLNLNVAVPRKVLKDRKSLVPVLVWLHGGSFISGSNSVSRYRPQALSAFAASAGKHVVIVQVNYRLGAFGFAVSKDIANELENLKSDKPEFVGNFGLHDQRNAFLWVKEHISDFGGDPANVTAFGVSAGSACIHQHMLSGSPLFDRAIMMSGTAGTLGPLPFSLYQREWENLSLKCHIEDYRPFDRLHKLRELSSEDLLNLYTSKPFGVYEDSGYLPSTWTLHNPTPLSRCKDIILGDVRVEGLILDGVSKRMPQEVLHHVLQEVFSDPVDLNRFCSTFGFISNTHSLGYLPYETYKEAFRLFFSLVIFQFPTLRVAETFSQDSSSESCDIGRKAYLYHFEEKSPWPGPTFGVAYHGQCATYVHLNEVGTKQFPESAANTSKEMAKAWIDFAYGEEPWQAYDPAAGKDKYLQFGPNGRCELQNIGDDTVRQQEYLPWIREHWPALQKLCRKLLFEG